MNKKATIEGLNRVTFEMLNGARWSITKRPWLRRRWLVKSHHWHQWLTMVVSNYTILGWFTRIDAEMLIVLWYLLLRYCLVHFLACFTSAGGGFMVIVLCTFKFKHNVLVKFTVRSSWMLTTFSILWEWGYVGVWMLGRFVGVYIVLVRGAYFYYSLRVLITLLW